METSNLFSFVERSEQSSASPARSLEMVRVSPTPSPYKYEDLVPSYYSHYKDYPLSVSPIKCSSPALIVNPAFVRSCHLFVEYVIPHTSAVLSRDLWLQKGPLSPSQDMNSVCCKGLGSGHCKVTYHTFHEFYGKMSDGSRIPLYMAVPCGHCDACRSRKRSSWIFRSLAETETSGSLPYFVTLTYNDHFYPSLGVLKSDVQNFFKRLRRQLDVTKEKPLRYLCASEYGSKTGRGHYHLLIWGLDAYCVNQSAAYLAIKKAWSFSFPVCDTARADYSFNQHYNVFVPSAYASLPSVKGTSVDYKGHRMFVPLGYANVKVCNSGGFRYVTKYLLKDCKTPSGCTPTFFLASRRKAIGKEWIELHAPFFREHLDVTYCAINDFSTGKSFVCALPDLYKRYCFPSPSVLLGRYSKLLKDYVHALCLCDYHNSICGVNYSVRPVIDALVSDFSCVDFTACFSHAELDDVLSPYLSPTGALPAPHVCYSVLADVMEPYAQLIMSYGCSPSGFSLFSPAQQSLLAYTAKRNEYLSSLSFRPVDVYHFHLQAAKEKAHYSQSDNF